MITRLAPRTLSNVRWISSSRAWVRTWIVTSSGTRFSSIKSRTKSKSGCEAEGKPTSISLNPMRTSTSKRRRLRWTSIGSISAWLPSRRSTLHHAGALVMARSGHLRSDRPTGGYGRYLWMGIRFIGYLYFLTSLAGKRKTSRVAMTQEVLCEHPEGARLDKQELYGLVSRVQGHEL